MLRPPSLPGPQPGETAAGGALDYAADVQPVWDKHCVECHSADATRRRARPERHARRRCSTSPTRTCPRTAQGPPDRGLLGPVIGENHPKTGNVDYLPARSLGSHASVLWPC